MKGEFFCDACRRYKKIELKVERKGKRPVCQYCSGKITKPVLKIAEVKANIG